ncbi:MAG: hydroxyacid dehydrogenase [Thaumarchaeota archaeon]|nr:hydroxyacid dehydrogenase [Candidatus Calditenuaceae archaeon]MDW8186538.1 hydroxyacid dehydrogenase [Nitrososphaerota archaeon]
MRKVLVACRLDQAGVEMMKGAGIDVAYREDISQEEFDGIYANYDAVIVRSNVRVRPVRGRGNLRLIVRAGVGLDNIDVSGFTSLGVRVLNTPDAVTRAVAELTIGLMLCLARDIVRLSGELKLGKWSKAQAQGVELAGKTVGVIGCGRIGGEVARLAMALGMRVLVNDVVRVSQDFLEQVKGRQVDLETLLRESDFVTVHVPLNPSTRGLIGEKELKLMKRTAYLINTARGDVVREEALKRALREGWIAGAALDVFSKEPPEDVELLRHPKLLPTPHIGAQTSEAQRIAGIEAAKLVISELGTRSA